MSNKITLEEVEYMADLLRMWGDFEKKHMIKIILLLLLSGQLIAEPHFAKENIRLIFDSNYTWQKQDNIVNKVISKAYAGKIKFDKIKVLNKTFPTPRVEVLDIMQKKDYMFQTYNHIKTKKWIKYRNIMITAAQTNNQNQNWFSGLANVNLLFDKCPRSHEAMVWANEVLDDDKDTTTLIADMILHELGHLIGAKHVETTTIMNTLAVKLTFDELRAGTLDFLLAWDLQSINEILYCYRRNKKR